MADPIVQRPENLAQTLARELPQAKIVLSASASGGGSVTHVAVPKGFDLKTIDDESLLATPRRTRASATLVDADSFLAYVNCHAAVNTTVWCNFNPVNYALDFTAVFDEHGPSLPGWRAHKAAFVPRLSVEWETWVKKNDGEQKAQMGFAEFLEQHEKDIAAGGNFPSSLDMMKMATEFEATAEKTIKSKIRLQSGGIQLEYVDTDDQATVQRMKVFERFQIGVPVFWSMPQPSIPVQAWPIEARLKYRIQQGAALFWYDLIRPDLVHELAALSLITKIRDGLGSVPLRMGSCT